MSETFSPKQSEGTADAEIAFYQDSFMYGPEKTQRDRYETRRMQATAELKQLLNKISREPNFQRLLSQDNIRVLHVAAGGGAVTQALQTVLKSYGLEQQATIVCVDRDPKSFQSHQEAGVEVDGFEIQDTGLFLKSCATEGRQFDLIVGLLVTGEVITDVAEFLNEMQPVVLASEEGTFPYALFTTSSPKEAHTLAFDDNWKVQDWVNQQNGQKASVPWISSETTYFGKFGIDKSFVVGTDPDAKLKKDTQMDFETYQDLMND